MPIFNYLRQFAGPRKIWGWVIAAEEWWYDVRRNVRTRADRAEEELSIAGDLSRGFWYRPVRPATGRSLLGDLPIQDYSDYTFVDVGSGKGRMLLMAADYPFRRIEGIELRKDLHDAAVGNIRQYKNFRAKSTRPPIGCINMDATNYEFPEGNLVLYFFNPFNEEVMQKILNRLDASLMQDPRDVILIMLYPQFTSSADGLATMQLLKDTGHCRFYRSGNPTQT
jgi:SAM-dependent methyltransferase